MCLVKESQTQLKDPLMIVSNDSLKSSLIAFERLWFACPLSDGSLSLFGFPFLFLLEFFGSLTPEKPLYRRFKKRVSFKTFQNLFKRGNAHTRAEEEKVNLFFSVVLKSLNELYSSLSSPKEK